jgi:hypothetical protein
MLSAMVKQREPSCGGLNPHPCPVFEFLGSAAPLSGEGRSLAVSGSARILGSPQREIQVCDRKQR